MAKRRLSDDEVGRDVSPDRDREGLAIRRAYDSCSEIRVSRKKMMAFFKKKHVTQATQKIPKGKLKLTVRDGFDRMTSRNCWINKIACSQQFCM